MSDPQDQARSRPLPPVRNRFKPGVSGNPGGRPKGGIAVSEALAILTAGGRLPSSSRAPAWDLANTMLRAAIDGDPRFAALVLDRLEGKIPTPVQATVEQPTGVVLVPAEQMAAEAWAKLAEATLAARRDEATNGGGVLPLKAGRDGVQA